MELTRNMAVSGRYSKLAPVCTPTHSWSFPAVSTRSAIDLFVWASFHKVGCQRAAAVEAA